MSNSTQTILLSGGTSGIGYQLLDQLHGRGHHLVVVARNENRLAQLAAQYERITSYACDLSSRSQIESLATKISERHPDISMLINNAGVQYTPGFLDDDFSFDSIEYEMTVNFLSHVWLTALLLPSLLQQNNHAAIVNISSGLAFAPKTRSAIYCASKAAIHSFSQSLRYQLAATPVRVQEVILPLVDTPMTQGRGSNKISAEWAATQIIRGIERQRPEIYIGKAKLLPLLMRISPSTVKKIMRKY